MNLRRRIYFGIVALSLLSLILGCAGSEKYGNTPVTRSGMRIDRLQENWKDYYVHWTGASSSFPYGIVFDPKDDDNRLELTGWWKPVEDQKQLAEIVPLLKSREGAFMGPMAGNFCVLRDILGSDKQSFGYVYTYSNSQVTARVVDKNTISVDISISGF